MNIIYPDIDAIIISYCGLNTGRLLQVNRWFHTAITKTRLYQEYNAGHGNSFPIVCSMGLLEYAQHIVTPTCDLDRAFIESCRSAHLNVARWLIQIAESDGYSKINIHTDNNSAFRMSCENEHLAIAQWLIQLGDTDMYSKIDIHIGYEYTFRSSCEKGHLAIAQWMIQLGESDGYTKIDIHACGDYAFIESCVFGHKHIAQWLIQLGDNGYGSYTDELRKKMMQLMPWSC